ncbi:hypothetical protein DICPUDRAFT_147185 [Dictyostelium purpureum]|uniref:Lysosome membrane protein 2 n=1 Tax=Dictyostelium purpureum TaxID=5786 RepID=F0Z7W0_DICPU|nr:uncharacterized protein DICPUDRAFT_147185 [Dictyostelium purpureum]EGC40014.1 hypothetical protein DICPUDRAFT_147185 [Dictyostelium purpureum]|eukprot:XP_003283517.1 hypothetical protein DICPUDRAFT_147185 [Dictyostelium purpureum]
MANAKALLGSGIILSVLGTVLFILSFALFPSLINTATRNAVIDAVVVDSPNAQRYSDWEGQQSVENLYLQYYYAWNLTNPEQFIQGKKPIFNQVGPFNYKYEYENDNVTFLDNGNLVEYTQVKKYIYLEDSPFDPTQVSITNINPAFLGLMFQMSAISSLIDLPAEDILFAIGGCGQMKLFLEYLNSDTFTEIAYFVSNPALYLNQYNAILKSLSNNQIYFFEQWANGTSTPTKGHGWNGMLVSFNSSEPSGITLESAQQIFNEANELSIINQNSGYTTWINAMLEDKSSIELLKNNLNITETQISTIIDWWINSFAQVYTNPFFLKQCDIPDLTYLGVCQFVSAIPLGGKSIVSIDFIQQPYTHGPIEIPLSTTIKLDVKPVVAYQNLFNPNSATNILNLNGMIAFIESVKSFSFSDYNISLEDGLLIITYSTIDISASYTFDTVQELYNTTSGLVVTRTVDEWLWTCEDGILDFLGVDQPCALQQNNTVNKPSIVFTGKDDLAMTNVYFEFQEQTTLTCWNGPVNVSAPTESGQFPPLQGIQDTIQIFEENTFRPVLLIRDGPSQVEGIDTQRYYLQNNSFPVSSVFNTLIPGFANLTTMQNLPLYVSLWDMYEVPPQYSTNYIQGLNQTWASAQVPLDLEPITGNALYYNLKLQINLALPNNSKWFSKSSMYNKTVPETITNGGYYFPSFKIGQTAQPSDSNVNLLKSQFKEMKTVQVAPVIIFAVVGGVLAIVGVTMGIFGYKKLKAQREGYKVIA